jgi:hypothetical protein
MGRTDAWHGALVAAACVLGCSGDPSTDQAFGLCGYGPCIGPGEDDEGEPDDDQGVDDDEGETGGQDETGGPEDPSGGGAANRGLPCDVQAVLTAECGMCHGAAPAFGAPMSLHDWDDLVLPAVTDVTRTVFEVAAERVVDPVKPMPPDGSIADADRQLLLDYFAAGAPEDPEADCDDAPPSDGDPIGPDALPCEADIVLTAHAPGAATGFVVPATGAENLYQCFAFQVPQTTTGQATAWAPIIDDERVLHHWILYRQSSAPSSDTFVCDASLQVSATFVAGWAPGGGNVELPSDVGLELGDPGDWYVLQIHYHNSAHYDDSVDGSGVAFCSAQQARPQTAGIVTFGTVGINIPAGASGHQETGTCGAWFGTAGWPEPLHVLAGSPHMHQLGRGLTTVVQRQGGGTEMITDVPVFDWQNQTMYWNEPEVIINPGDSVHTTCTFDNPNAYNVGFGERSEDEMCFNFVLAYPIQGLAERNCGIIL